MMPPAKITVSSDKNELQFTQTLKTKNEILHEYKFTKSETKKGYLVTFSEPVLTKFLSNRILIINKHEN